MVEPCALLLPGNALHEEASEVSLEKFLLLIELQTIDEPKDVLHS